jgi:hypothetical protein
LIPAGVGYHHGEGEYTATSGAGRNRWATGHTWRSKHRREKMVTAFIGVLVAVAIVLVLLKVALFGGLLGLVALVLLVLLVLGRI